MPDAYKQLYQGQVPASATTLYTVPGATSAIVKHMVATNPTGTARTLTLWRGGSTDPFVILPATTIPAGDFLEWDGTMALNTGETIVGQASAASAISLTVDGDEIT